MEWSGRRAERSRRKRPQEAAERNLGECAECTLGVCAGALVTCNVCVREHLGSVRAHPVHAHARDQNPVGAQLAGATETRKDTSVLGFIEQGVSSKES